MLNPPMPDACHRLDADAATELTHDEVLERSELGRRLRGSIFPADKWAVIDCAEEEHAPAPLLASLRRLPEGEYRNVGGVWEALGGRRDQRSPEPAPTPVQKFGFRFSAPFRLAARVFLVDPPHAWVAVQPGPDGVLTVRYGPWRVETPLTNVRGAEATGPYAMVKTIGPPHVSLVDRGLTFASNRDRGVCIRFAEPVRGVDVLGVIRHPALTVTVEDVDGLVAALDAAASA
jgi:hypothetical protein